MMPLGFNWDLLRVRWDVPLLLKHIKATSVCEVGVKDGGFFQTILSPAVNIAIAIDVWDEFSSKSQNDIGRTRDALKDSHKAFCQKYQDDKRVIIIKKQSSRAYLEIPDESLDFVYLDADHTYDAVRGDIENFYPKIKKGGVLAGHDYFNYTFKGIPFGVVRAVNEFTSRNNLFLHTTKEMKFKSYFIPKITT